MGSDVRRLEDILACAEELEGYLKGTDPAAFLGDKLRQRAVERLITIIGEAAKQLDQSTRDSIDQPWQDIIRLRDKAIHAYRSLRPERLYDIAAVSVPPLAEAIRAYLDH